MMPYFPPPNENDTPPPQLGPSRSTSNNLPHELGAVDQQEIAGPSALKSKIEAQQEIIDKQNAELQQTKSQLRRITEAFDALKRQYDARGALLDIRTNELSAADKYLQRIDEVPAEQIESAFRDLNSQILAISITCSDFDQLEARFARRTNTATISTDVTNNLVQIMGQRLMRSLEFTRHQVVVQISMQTVMCFLISRAADIYPFSPTRKAAAGRGIWAAYEDMHENELQSVSARWRALGSKYNKKPNHLKELRREMSICTLQYLARILWISGLSDNQIDLEKFNEACVGDAVRALWTSAIQLAEKLKEQVVSSDYVLHHIFPRTTYDAYVMSPQILSEENKAIATEGNVLCTTEMGLYRRTNIGKPGETSGKIKEPEMIEKAVVVLEEELNSLLKI